MQEKDVVVGCPAAECPESRDARARMAAEKVQGIVERTVPPRQRGLGAPPHKKSPKPEPETMHGGRFHSPFGTFIASEQTGQSRRLGTWALMSGKDPCSATCLKFQ